LLNYVVLRALWKIDVHLISTLVNKSLYYIIIILLLLLLLLLYHYMLLCLTYLRNMYEFYEK